MPSSPKYAGFRTSASAHADECAPARSQPGSDQHEQRIVAKRAAVLAHRYTQRTDLVMARRIEQARQNREYGSNEKHPKASLRSAGPRVARSEEHTSELQSHVNLVCRLLLDKKKQNINTITFDKNKKKNTK